MSYNRQIFEHKHLLTADQMNAIDIGLADAYVELDKKQPKGDYALKTEIVKDLSQLNQNANYRTVSDAEKATWEAKSNFSGKYEDLTGIPADLATESYVDEKFADINVDISAVSYDEIQDLSLNERTIAKNNIGVYIGSEEPADALDGDIWLDSDADSTYTVSQVTSVNMVKADNVITATMNLDNGDTITSIINLNDDGYPVAITTDGVECTINWEGF